MINFLKYRAAYFLFSLAVIFLGLYFVISSGFVFSIDFVGGGVLEFVGSATQSQKAQNLISKKYPDLDFQQTSQGFIIKSTDLRKGTAEQISREITQSFQVKKTRFELVGPSISQGNVFKIAVATLIAIMGILLYVAFNFRDWRYGAAAIVALLHDGFVLVGVWSILGHFLGVELDVLFVTALLTTMSFSVHDTIVIFDKIQEEERQSTFQNLADRINWALNLTMMRSVNNSLTVVIMLSSLIILGGESTRAFAISLLIGTITGTYSSPFVATPVYYLLTKKASAA